MAWSTPGTAVTGATATAAFWNANVRDNLGALNPLDSVAATSWSPTLEATTTNPETSSVTGRYWRVGPLVYAAARWVIDPSAGSGGTGSGTYFVTLPVASSGLTAATGSNGQAVGSWRGVDDSASASNVLGTVVLRTASVAQFALHNGTLVTDSSPITWTTGDVLTFFAVYPAA